jgi:hypothetical protein
MNRRGQVLLIVAFLIPIMLLFLAVAVDAGRIFLERERMQRSAGAAANAGISVVADRMVALAADRRAHAAATPVPVGNMPVTSTPRPDDVVIWLENEDRAVLVSPAMQAEVERAAREYLERNGFRSEADVNLQVQIEYPQPGYDPQAVQVKVLSIRVHIERRIEVLLADLLNEDWVVLRVDARSQIPQR